MIYYQLHNGIQATDVTAESTATTVVKFDGEHYWNYVTTSKDKIYHTHHDSDNVICYTVTGQKVWEYEDGSILKSIRGVTIDNDSNVYVISFGNSSLVVLSPDGRDARQLLGEENGIKSSYGIHFDQGRNILLVTNLRGTVFVYKIN